jgi:outer membrane protein TolC
MARQHASGRGLRLVLAGAALASALATSTATAQPLPQPALQRPLQPPATPTLCVDDSPPLLAVTPEAEAVAAARRTLQSMLQRALARSQSVGAARLLTEAAESDLEEAQATPLPRATLSGGANDAGIRQSGLGRSGAQWRADLSVSAPLFDAGRSEALVAWRERLLEAARQGELDAREQVALQTMLQALEQQRYRLQSQVYQRYVARMGCLVGALERIVEADRGRASELLQVHNTLRQAELALALTRSQQRQAEIRLRRLVGDELPTQAPLEALLAAPPPLERVLDDAARSSAVLQLSAQAEAQQQLLRAQRAERQPQASWSINRSRITGGTVDGYSTWSAGINLSVPLLDPGARPALRATEQRGESVLAQRDDVLASRLQRVAEIHEQARAAFERARASAEVQQGSQRLREATLLQWQQLGRRSLFDVISTESEYHNLLVTRINALLDGQQATAQLWSLGRGVQSALD